MRGRILVWSAGGIAAGGIAGLSAYLAVAGLADASAAAGVLVAFVELVALVVGIYGIACERRNSPVNQTVAGTAVGGQLSQIHGIRGGVHIRRRGAATAGPTLPVVSEDNVLPPNDGQSVIRSNVAGHLDQVDDIGGDVNMELD
jgi:hypothetical protein